MSKTCYLVNYLNGNKYTEYAENVLSGKFITCQYVKDVCARFLAWLDREDIEFRAEKVDRVVRFVENLEHFTGQFAGQKFILSDWQRFVIYYVYGFYYKNTNDRVIKHVILDVSRKNGKTALVAALALYALIGEKEENAEVDCLANSKNQASILL